jgi:hypothetical protein
MGMIPTADGMGVIQMASSYAGNDLNEMLIGRSPILVPGTRYEIVNQNSGLALAVPGGSTVHGTLLQQVPLNEKPGVAWMLKDLQGERFAFISPATGMAVDDYQTKIRNGSPVAVWDSNLLPFQQWVPIPTGDGAFKLRNVNANRVLTVLGSSLKPGASAVLWDDDGAPGSAWKLVPRGLPEQN